MTVLSLSMLACTLWPSPSLSASSFPSHLDPEIKEAADRYLPGVDWRLYKAQLYQESQLDPDAESPVGAKGVAQFMPGTWRQVSRQLGFEHLSPHVADVAIPAGAYYMSQLRNRWSSPRPKMDRLSLSMASYNAGFGNLLAAQRKADMAVRYEPIIQTLPKVTGEHAKETTTYVQRIWRYWQQMVLGE